jgi:signal transduction histidine kinase
VSASLPRTARLDRLRPLLAGWAVLAALFFLHDAVGSRGDPGQAPWAWIALAQAIQWGAWAALSPLILLLAELRPLRRRGRLTSVGIYLLAGVAALAAHTALTAFATASIWWLGGPDLRGAARGSFELDLAVFLAAALGANALALERARRRRQLEAAGLEAELERARFERLQQQLQPHFLFNTLNVVAGLIPLDPARAERVVEQVSLLLRESLRRGPGLHTLGEEMELVGAYLDIQGQRFGARLGWTADVPEALLGAQVPRWILQPLVENSIVHALAKSSGRTEVRVAARSGDDGLRLTVEDDGPGFSATALESATAGVGLGATEAILRRAFAGRASLRRANRAEGGARVVIILPLQAELG